MHMSTERLIIGPKRLRSFVENCGDERLDRASTGSSIEHEMGREAFQVFSYLLKVLPSRLGLWGLIAPDHSEPSSVDCRRVGEVTWDKKLLPNYQRNNPRRVAEGVLREDKAFLAHFHTGTFQGLSVAVGWIDQSGADSKKCLLIGDTESTGRQLSLDFSNYLAFKL